MSDFMRTLCKIAIPVTLHGMLQASFSIVDQIMIGQLGEAGIAAVGLCSNFTLIFSVMSGAVGTVAGILIAQFLGAEEHTEAWRSLDVSLVCGGVLAALFLLTAGGFPAQVLGLYTADDAILRVGAGYFRIVAFSYLPMAVSTVLSAWLRCKEHAAVPFWASFGAVAANTGLNYLLIFGKLGAPTMGVTGAALATVIGQCVGALVAFICNHKFNPDVKLQFRGFRPDGRIIRTIYAIGIPSIIMQSIGSVMTYSMNRILITFSSTATAVFGVYFKLQSFFFMPVFGLNNGITPIIAFNYGAQNRKRMVKTIKLSMATAFCIMLFGCSTHLLICLRSASLRFVSSVSITCLHGSASSAVLYSRRLERPCSV